MATKKFNFGIFIDGEPVTGSSEVYCQIMKVSNNTYLDWVGNTFGATGTPKVMTEISSTYLPGYYQASIDIAGWADGEYLISTYYDDGVDEAYSIDSMTVANGAEVSVNINSLVGTPVDMGDGATVSAMLTAIGGGSFSKATDSLKVISDNVDTIDGIVDDIDSKTTNLPSDPASTTDVTTSEGVITAAINGLNDIQASDIWDYTAGPGSLTMGNYQVGTRTSVYNSISMALEKDTAANVVMYLDTWDGNNMTGLGSGAMNFYIYKNYGLPSLISRTVTEIGVGVYMVALQAGDTDTIGSLGLQFGYKDQGSTRYKVFEFQVVYSVENDLLK